MITRTATWKPRIAHAVRPVGRASSTATGALIASSPRILPFADDAQYGPTWAQARANRGAPPSGQDVARPPRDEGSIHETAGRVMCSAVSRPNGQCSLAVTAPRRAVTCFSDTRSPATQFALQNARSVQAGAAAAVAISSRRGA